MPVKILASADLHLGRKSANVLHSAEESSVRYTWHKMTETAIRLKVDILLLAGDIVDQDNRFYEAVGPLQEGFQKLKLAGIHVYVVAGNHDYNVLPELIRTEQYDHVHLLGENGTWEIQTWKNEKEKIQICGWSFPSLHYTGDPLHSFLSIQSDPDVPVIGMLHGDADIPESNYAPVRLSDLQNTNIDAWILGHIHKGQELHASNPYIAYPGSPQAMSSAEPGAHGAVLLTVNGKDIQAEKVPLSPVRYESLKIDVSDAKDEASVRKLLTSKLTEQGKQLLTELENVSWLIFDVILAGAHPQINEVSKWTEGITEFESTLEGGTCLIVRKVYNETRQSVGDLESIAKEATPAGKLAESILLLEKGKSSPFTDKLISEWKHKQEDILTSGTYTNLNRETSSNRDEEARKFILQESKRLLGVLIAQKQS